jgi:predicted anti-sigma-YlaC factor YlaD
MCEDVRVALSARLDGDDFRSPLDIDGHIAACAECRAWLAAAQSLRVPPIEAPDLTARILAAVAADREAATDAARRIRGRILQVALVISAAVQLALAIPELFTAAHVGREAASFDIALAVGFALAAWRPERARAFVPVAFVLAGCLTLTSIFDIARGIAFPTHEISHAAALAQAGLLLALSRRTASPRLRGTKAVLS